jgi:hypothetical protein
MIEKHSYVHELKEYLVRTNPNRGKSLQLHVLLSAHLTKPEARGISTFSGKNYKTLSYNKPSFEFEVCI